MAITAHGLKLEKRWARFFKFFLRALDFFLPSNLFQPRCVHQLHHFLCFFSALQFSAFDGPPPPPKAPARYCVYRGLQGVTRGYTGLQEVTEGYRGLQKVTRGYRGLQVITDGYMGLQRVTEGYRGL